MSRRKPAAIRWDHVTDNQGLAERLTAVRRIGVWGGLKTGQSRASVGLLTPTEPEGAPWMQSSSRFPTRSRPGTEFEPPVVSDSGSRVGSLFALERRGDRWVIVAQFAFSGGVASQGAERAPIDDVLYEARLARRGH